MDSLELIQLRSSLLLYLRQFFAAEGVLEVDTPLLYPFASPDPYLEHLSLVVDQQQFFLQSSPEFAMKRLLADVRQSMYQICKAFRNDGIGSRHLREFTMLEWYMVDYNLDALRSQLINLLKPILPIKSIQVLTYREAFSRILGLDPHLASPTELQSKVTEHTTAVNVASFSKDDCLSLLFSECVETSLDRESLVFITAFPQSQAALAMLGHDEQGQCVAQRFEIFFGGLELANAYQEECSATVLRERFDKENTLRKAYGKPLIPLDNSLLEATEKGFPACSGIALGLERLLMVMSGSKHITELAHFQ